MSKTNASIAVAVDPFENTSSSLSGNTSGSGCSIEKAPPDIAGAVKRFKQALGEDNLALKESKKYLNEAVQIIESLQKLKAPPHIHQNVVREESAIMAKILQEVRSIKATITHNHSAVRTHGMSWAKVAGQTTSTGTILRIESEDEKKAIAKLSSEELVKKIGIKEVIGARKMTNGQVKVYFAGQGTKEIMEKQKEWTTKLATTAQIASPSYQVLVHDMPLSFDLENPEQIKELQKENMLYIQGIGIQKAAWLKKNKQPGKNAGSMIVWFSEAEYADKAIEKGLVWKYEVKATEIFRSGFRAIQCFNCQRFGHIARNCTAEAKCGHCAGVHNSRSCLGENEVRCCNCGKKHSAWDQSCPTKLAAKAKATQNRIQDTGRYQIEQDQPKKLDFDWQIVGSKKRRTETSPSQSVTFVGSGNRHRGPGRPRKCPILEPLFPAQKLFPANVTSQLIETPQIVGSSLIQATNEVVQSLAPQCEMSS